MLSTFTMRSKLSYGLEFKLAITIDFYFLHKNQISGHIFPASLGNQSHLYLMISCFLLYLILYFYLYYFCSYCYEEGRVAAPMTLPIDPETFLEKERIGSLLEEWTKGLL